MLQVCNNPDVLSLKYLEERLKLTVNREKSRTVSVFAIRNFKFLGFALGRNGKGTYVRVHSKSWKKFKSRLKELSSRKRCQSIKPNLEKIKVYARGWLNYYGIASMKNNIDEINGWLYHRIRMCIWKQWKKPRTKYKNLVDQIINNWLHFTKRLLVKFHRAYKSNDRLLDLHLLHQNIYKFCLQVPALY